MSKVLVVEDDADIRRLLELRLTRLGHRVTSVGSAGDALEHLHEHGIPDLVVLDIVMRHVSGIDLLRTLRDDPASVDLPVILLTARDFQDDIRVARELHADLMIKPIESVTLNRALDRALHPVG